MSAINSEPTRDLKKLETIIHVKCCPSCNLGVVNETAKRVYTCDCSNCGEVYDLSSLSESMIPALLDRYERAAGRPGLESSPR